MRFVPEAPDVARSLQVKKMRITGRTAPHLDCTTKTRADRSRCRTEGYFAQRAPTMKATRDDRYSHR